MIKTMDNRKPYILGMQNNFYHKIIILFRKNKKKQLSEWQMITLWCEIT